MNKEMYYVGMDIHKKNIAICVKRVDGTVLEESNIKAIKPELSKWLDTYSNPLLVGIETTLFAPWVYDLLEPRVHEVKVANTTRLRALSKNKNDRIDANMLADLLRVDLFPECYMHPQEHRELRDLMRFRFYIVRMAVKFKNKLAGQLMAGGIPYDGKKLHQKGYFRDFLYSLEDIPESLLETLKFDRRMIDIFTSYQNQIIHKLEKDPALKERLRRLQTINGVGPVLSLVWALEIGDVNRFPNSKHLVSYCGLCSAQKSSGGKNYRTPISKQRNKYLQCMLVEVAKIAPIYNPVLAELHAKEKEKGHSNRATMCVARKLLKFLYSVDKNQKDYELYPEKRELSRRQL